MSHADKRLRDAYPYNDSFNAMEVSTADRRFEQLIERKERLVERSRFGILALNGASAIGVLTNYNSLRPHLDIEPRIVLTFFAVGMIFSLVSIFFETNFVGHRAAQMFGHLSLLRDKRATLDNHYTEKSEARLGEQLKEIGERAERGWMTKIALDDTKDGLPSDFAFSPAALIALNCAGAAWIGGILALICGIF